MCRSLFLKIDQYNFEWYNRDKFKEVSKEKILLL